ncbi:MAG: transcriptional repressor [Peptoniphilaceae bacterium]|nr:transcriptional repressor [Peptoniphilaceae bacterium]MDY6085688.1 transcriptional repressor [Peptoniphilaceae bacterium]
MKQIRNSKQRELVLRLVRERPAHPTADEIYEMARKINPRISRGTVYRNLNLLAERGEIQRLEMMDGPVHYDPIQEPHYHFLCRKCHQVFNTPIPYQDSLNQTPANMEGFQTEGHRLFLVGLCPDCAKAEKES